MSIEGRRESGAAAIRAALEVIVLTAVALSSGCGRFACETEERTMVLQAVGTAGAAATAAELRLFQWRGNEPWDALVIHVGVVPRPAEDARLVRVRAGAPDAPGDELLSMPGRREAATDLLVYIEGPYPGEMPFELFWRRLEMGDVFVEVVLDGGSAPIAIGPLQVSANSGWREGCTQD